MLFRRLDRRAVNTTLGSSLTIIAFAAAIGAPGCNSPDLQTLCEERAACVGGNEKDVDACVVSAETTEYIVDDIGCNDEYVDYFDCLLEKGACRVEPQGTPCMTSADCPGGQCTTANECETKDFQPEGDDCEVERTAFNRCFDLD